MFPDYPVWLHGVFQHPLYAAFAERVRFRHATAPESTREQQLATVAPAVAAEIQSLRQEQAHQLVSIQREQARQVAMQRSIDRLQELVLNSLHQQQRAIAIVPIQNHGTRVVLAYEASSPALACAPCRRWWVEGVRLD
jgi:hypothetical protein